jgi:hypothetical protein
MIEPQDLAIETYPSSKRSAWVCNPETGVKITHIPTGISVSKNEGSQNKSKAAALTELTTLVENAGNPDNYRKERLVEHLSDGKTALAWVGEDASGAGAKDKAALLVRTEERDDNIWFIDTNGASWPEAIAVSAIDAKQFLVKSTF